MSPAEKYAMCMAEAGYPLFSCFQLPHEPELIRAASSPDYTMESRPEYWAARYQAYRLVFGDEGVRVCAQHYAEQKLENWWGGITEMTCPCYGD